MRVAPTSLSGVLLIDPVIVADERGWFAETFRADRYAAAVAEAAFVQDNVSVSVRGVIRGLHFQHPHGQAKLVHVVRGEVLDVAVDVRTGSPRRGRWVSTVLSADNHRQLFIPSGFAHGFAVLSAEAVVVYKCSDYYSPAAERCIRWNDPDLAIEWPVGDPVLSAKDRAAPLLRDLPADTLPSM